MAREIGPKIGIDGEAQYRKQINSIIQQAKTLDAEMRAVASSFDEEANAQKRNKAVGEQLAKQIDVQKQKVKLLADMAEKSAKATGETSKETLQWREALANAKTELNRLESGLDSTTKKSSVFGDTLKAMLSRDVIVGGLKLLKDGIVEVGKAAASFAKDVVEAYGEFEQLEGGIKKLFGEEDAQKVIQNAQNAYKTAGMDANEYLSTLTSFSAALIKSLGGDTEEAANYADRAIRDMSDNANTFGTDISQLQNAYKNFAKGQYQMLDSLQLGYGGTKEGMEQLIKDAASYTDVQKELGITVDESSLSFENIVNAISVVQKHLNMTGTTAKEASGTIQGSISAMKASFQNFVIGLGAENADIDMLFQNLVSGFQDVVTNVQPIIERLINYIPGIVDAVVPVLQSMLPALVSTAADLFNGFIGAIVSVLPDIIPVAVDAIMLFINTIVNNIPALIDAGITLILALANGLIKALPDLVGQVPVIITHLVSAIVKNLPSIIEAGLNLASALIKGLISGAGNVVQAVYAIISSIKETFSGGVDAAKSWGKDLIYNFANGILDHAREVWEAIKGVANDIWSLLHFSEPDEGPLKNFSTFAPDMMKTFAQGIIRNQHLVSDAAAQAMEGVSGAMTIGGGTSNAYNYGGISIVVNQQPGESSEALVDRLMVRMQNRIDSKKAVFA